MSTTALRRHELAAFLRSRRERITPEDAGLPGGHRRRTAGLRREEVAQLSGVGVTWYTWLEQGRPIRASVQVLEAVARTLRLDAIERQHLFRLAEVPDTAHPEHSGPVLRPQIQVVLTATRASTSGGSPRLARAPEFAGHAGPATGPRWSPSCARHVGTRPGPASSGGWSGQPRVPPPRPIRITTPRCSGIRSTRGWR